MVKDPNDIMAAFKWATNDELASYREQGYQRLKKG
jgi:hypothetical protein